MRHSMKALLGVLLLLAPVSAFAYPHGPAGSSPYRASGAMSPWYISVTGGYLISPRFETDSVQPTSVVTTFASKNGYSIGGAVGYALPGYGRLELEGAYSRSKLDNVLILGATVGIDGESTTWTGMANAYYDFVTNTKWTPYLGAGVGYTYHSENIFLPGTSVVSDKSDSSPAYQGLAGVSYKISPQTALFTGYKYMRTLNKLRFRTDVGGNPEIKGLYSSHTIQAGVRFNF